MAPFWLSRTGSNSEPNSQTYESNGGGYYTKTRENRPLVGAMGVDGAYLIGAVSGYGIMSACGVGDLIAAHVTGAELPNYSGAFELSRYDDPEYQRKLENWEDSGQL